MVGIPLKWAGISFLPTHSHTHTTWPTAATRALQDWNCSPLQRSVSNQIVCSCHTHPLTIVTCKTLKIESSKNFHKTHTHAHTHTHTRTHTRTHTHAHDTHTHTHTEHVLSETRIKTEFVVHSKFKTLVPRIQLLSKEYKLAIHGSFHTELWSPQSYHARY